MPWSTDFSMTLAVVLFLFFFWRGGGGGGGCVKKETINFIFVQAKIFLTSFHSMLEANRKSQIASLC